MKIITEHIEIAIMEHFDFSRHLIVPNVSNMMGLVPFETDMVVMTKANYVHGFEIKVSKSDLMADFKKEQHIHFDHRFRGKKGLERWYGKFKTFSYAVPEELKNCALEVIPDFTGLYIIDDKMKLKQIKDSPILFNHKWTEKERIYLKRLGAMRIYNLKRTIAKFKEETL